MRLYEPGDYEQVMSWWVKRDKAPIPREYFSDVGFIEDGKAAVFLYMTNSAVCYLEMLISNPEAEANQAIDDVIKRGIEEARALGFKVVIASSNKRSVIERVQDLGFSASPGYVQVIYNL